MIEILRKSDRKSLFQKHNENHAEAVKHMIGEKIEVYDILIKIVFKFINLCSEKINCQEREKRMIYLEG